MLENRPFLCYDIRIEFFGDEIDRISEIDVLTGEVLGTRNHISIFPASNYVNNS